MAYKLLLADDSVTIQRVIELTFADEDIEVIAVGDGQLAVDCLDADPPDIVLADVDMPKRNGYEVAAYVRSRPALAHIPVVLLTGAFEPVDQARAAAAGSSDVLSKPFEPQMVINRVKQLLGRKPSDEETVPQASEPPARGAFMKEAPAVPAPARPAAEQPPQPISLDDYFDQLDAAFSNLSGGTQPPAPAAAPPTDDAWMDTPAVPAEPVTSSVQPAPPPAPFREPIVAPPPPAPAKPVRVPEPVLAAPPPPPPPPPPVVVPEPLPIPPPVVAKPVPAMPAAPAPAAPAPAPVPPPARATANPFAELSAVKAEAAARPPAPVITDEVIEEVVARVLNRLSDRVVRETVTEIVSRTAERLVQDEIQRIKAEGQ